MTGSTKSEAQVNGRSRAVEITVVACRASPTGGDAAPVTAILIQDDVPGPLALEGGKSVQESLLPITAAFARDACAIAAALRGALPGGTFDRLVCELLRMKASDFRVPWSALECRSERSSD